MKKIIIVDDEVDILDVLSYNFKKAGFEVRTSSSSLDGLELIKAEKPDLVILDLMMPQMDGIEVCQEIRKMDTLTHTLVLFLTARNEDYTQVAIYDSGADSYVSKPISPRVLVSKVQALLRRQEINLNTPVGKDLDGLESIIVDSRAYKIYKGDKEIELPKKEFEILKMFTENPGALLKREEIFHRVWGDDVIVGDRTLDVHIRKLRQKIGDEFIKTVKGVGYKFEQ